MVAGFADATLCKVVLVTSCITTYIVWGLEKQEVMQLSLRVITAAELWRLFSYLFVWEGLGEMITGSVLLYQLRDIERQMGPKKFGAFLVLVAFMSTSFLLTTLLMFPMVRPATGPIPFLFALIVLYFVFIPTVNSQFLGALGLKFSEKSIVYAVALQLFFSGGTTTALPAVCGLIAGTLYRSDVLSLQDVRMPSCVNRCCGFLHPLVRSNRRSVIGQRGGGARIPGARAGVPQVATVGQQLLTPQPLQPGRGAAARRPAAVRRPPASPPPNTTPEQEAAALESALRTLVGMGFDRDSAAAALLAHRNDVQSAADYLLSHPAALANGGGDSPGHSHAH